MLRRHTRLYLKILLGLRGRGHTLRGWKEIKQMNKRIDSLRMKLDKSVKNERKL